MALSSDPQASRRAEPYQSDAQLVTYTNPFPEWSRAMAPEKTTVLKKEEVPCPKCGSSDTRPSSSKSLADFLLFFFDFDNARCRKCNARFRVWRTRHASRELQKNI